MPSLLNDIKEMETAGFPKEKIESFKQEKINEMQSAGFTDDAILKEFGHNSLDTTPIKDFWNNIIKQNREEKKDLYEKLKEVEKNEPDNISLKEELVGKIFEPTKYWKRGWGAGVWDLHQAYVNDGQLPELYSTDMPEDTGFVERNIMNIARLTKDLPAYIAVGLPLGLLTRNKNVAAAGSGFVVGSMRETYLKGLQNDQVNNFKEFFDIWTKEGIKAGGIEAAQILSAISAGGLAKNILGKTALQTAAFEATGAVLHQELPSKEQLMDSFFLFGLFNVGGRGYSKIKETIVKKNKDPIKLAEELNLDKTTLEDYGSTNIKNPRAFGGDKPVTLKPDKFKDGFNLDTPAERKLFSKMRMTDPEQVIAATEKLAKKADDFTNNYIDRLNPIRKLISRVENTKNMKGVLNVYERFRQQLGMEYRGGTFIEKGTQNAKLQTNGKGLKEILDPLIDKKSTLNLKERDIRNKKTYSEFGVYKVAKRVLELENRGIKHGMDVNAAREVANNPKNIKRFEKISKEFDAYNTRLLEYIRDKGLITKEAFNAMTEANKNYVPFARVMEAEVGTKGYTEGVSNPLKRIKGSEKDIIDPIETTYSNTFHLIKLAERNAAMVEFFDFIEKNKKSFPDINKKVITKSIKLEKKELAKFVENPEALSDIAADNLRVFRREFIKPEKDSVGVWRKGKYEVWEVGEVLAEAMKDFNPREASTAVKYFAVPARLLRAGATLALDFVGANFLRDTVQASVYSKYGFVPILSSMQGLMTIFGAKIGLKKSVEIYNNWIKSGGMQSTLLSLDRAVFDKPAFDILNKGPIRNKVQNPLEILRVISETFENSTRISEFRRAYAAERKAGLNHKDALDRAGFESRDITIDFAKMGTKMRVLNQISAFYNAKVQGYRKIYEAAKERPVRATMAIFSGIMLPTALLWYINRDDERIQSQPEWVKRNYWLIASGEGDDAVIYKIPKPFDVGVVFSGLTEALLESAFGDEKNKEIMDTALGEYMFDTAVGLIPQPTAVMPFFEGAFNYSVFQKRPLVPHYMDKNLPNKYQYTQFTSESAKLLGRAINAISPDDTKLNNPIYIDNLLKTWGGTLGRYTIQLADKALLEAGVVDKPIQPTKKLSDLPVIRAFIARYPDAQSEYITDFYKELNKVQKEINSITALEKEGRVIESQNLLKSLEGKNRLQLVNVGEALKELNAIIRNIYNNKEYNADEKRELIDAHYMLMIQFAKRGLQYMNIKVEDQQKK